LYRMISLGMAASSVGNHRGWDRITPPSVPPSEIGAAGNGNLTISTVQPPGAAAVFVLIIISKLVRAVAATFIRRWGKGRRFVK
jgi:hypothetical protein